MCLWRGRTENSFYVKQTRIPNILLTECSEFWSQLLKISSCRPRKCGRNVWVVLHGRFFLPVRVKISDQELHIFWVSGICLFLKDCSVVENSRLLLTVRSGVSDKAGSPVIATSCLTTRSVKPLRGTPGNMRLKHTYSPAMVNISMKQMVWRGGISVDRKSLVFFQKFVWNAVQGSGLLCWVFQCCVCDFIARLVNPVQIHIWSRWPKAGMIFQVCI